MKKAQSRICPVCGKKFEVVAIIYGLVDRDVFEEEAAGKLKIGGCVIIDGKSPKWYCKRDGAEFGVYHR